MVGHLISVIGFRIYSSNYIPCVNLFFDPVNRKVFPIPDLYAIITAYFVIDDHRVIIKKNFSAPTAYEAVFITINRFHQIFILIIGSRDCGNVRLSAVFIIRRRHNIQGLLPIFIGGADI